MCIRGSVGTLAAVLVAYRHAIERLLKGGLSALGNSGFYRHPIETLNASAELKFIWLLLLGSIPTGIIALLFKTQLESVFNAVQLVRVMLIVTGVLLQLPRLRRSKMDVQLKTWHAPLIGIAQGCAITPGISRSGATISLALLFGVSAKTAAEYSFLLSIPAILGAVVLKIRDVGDTVIPIHVVGAGMLAAFVVGYIALRFLLVMLNRGKFSVFSYYCVALGIISFLLSALR